MEVQLNQKSLQFLGYTDFLYNALPDYDGSRQNLVITLDHIQEWSGEFEGTDLKIYDYVKAFLATLLGKAYSESHPVNQNFGLATYDNDRLTFFGRPIIVKLDDEIQLVIGAKIDDQGYDYTRIPLVFSPTGISLKDSAIKSLDVESLEVPDSKDMNKTVKVPILVFNVMVGTVKTVAEIPIRLAKDVTYTDFKEAWKEKDVEALKEMVGGLFGASCSISYMFSNHFKAGSFPKSGIVLKIIGGSVNESKKDAKTLVSVLYRVDTSGLPDVDVISTGGEPKNTEPVSLSSVTGIYVNKDHNAGKPFSATNQPSPENPWYLYIQGRGRSDREVPLHTIYTNVLPTRIKTILNAQKAPTYFALKTRSAPGLVPFDTDDDF